VPVLWNPIKNIFGIPVTFRYSIGRCVLLRAEPFAIGECVSKAGPFAIGGCVSKTESLNVTCRSIIHKNNTLNENIEI